MHIAQNMLGRFFTLGLITLYKTLAKNFHCGIIRMYPKTIEKTVLNENKGINRSLINPVYADNFVKHIIIDYDRIDLKYN